MTELKFKSGEIVLNPTMIAKAYHPLVAAELAGLDAQEARVFTLHLPVEETGPAWVIETKPGDEVLYVAVHNTRNQLSRFVFGVEPKVGPQQLTIIMKWRSRQNGYLIKSLAKGSPTAPEPWEEDATELTNVWWGRHAYVYDPANPLLQNSFVWRHGLLHCTRCNLRQARAKAVQVGDLLYCNRCYDEANGAALVRTNIGGWENLKTLP